MYHASRLARAFTSPKIMNGPPRMSFSQAAMVAKESEDGEVEREDYPVPLSPFTGELSKEVELQRALVAEVAMKAGPAIARENVLVEDDWLMVVNKPRGLHCEHVFATAANLCSSEGTADEVQARSSDSQKSVVPCNGSPCRANVSGGVEYGWSNSLAWPGARISTRGYSSPTRTFGYFSSARACLEVPSNSGSALQPLRLILSCQLHLLD